MDKKTNTLSDDSMHGFRSYLLRRGRSQATCKSYLSDLRAMQRWLASSTDGSPIPHLPPERLEEAALRWMENSRTEGLAPATITRRLATLRQFGRYLGVEVLADYKAPPSAPARPHPLPGGVGDVEAMLDSAIDSSEEAMIILCGFAGLRISEARSVTPLSFLLDDGKVSVTVTGKGYKRRVVPVPSRVSGRLLEVAGRRESAQPLVLLSDSQARKAWKKAARRAGVRDSSTHDGRATVATAILGATGNLRLAQEVLGHSSVETTQVYTGVTRDQLTSAMEAI